MSISIYKRRSGAGYVTSTVEKLEELFRGIPRGSKNVKVFCCDNNGLHSYNFYFFATFANPSINIKTKMEWGRVFGDSATYIHPSRYNTIEEEMQRFAERCWSIAWEDGRY